MKYMRSNMQLILRSFNSMTLMLINLSILLYIFRRLFRAMRDHYKLMAEAKQFNSLVCQSRSSLDYISAKVFEAMEEIKEDIENELHVTDELTQLGSKMALALQHFSALEESALEFARMDRNMESVRVETPVDINVEMRKVFVAAKKKKERLAQLEESKQRSRSKLSNTNPTRNAVSKFSTTKPRSQLTF